MSMRAGWRSAGLVWPTLATLVALAILLALGTWQMQRKSWKEGLVAAVAAKSRMPPVAIGDLLARPFGPDDVFTRVRVSGTFLHDAEFHVYAPQSQGPHWSVVTPLRLTDPVGTGRRNPIQSILIMRGIVPEALKSAAARPEGQDQGVVTLTGRLRSGGRSFFDGEPDTTRNQWYAFDLEAMRLALASRAVAGSGSGTGEEALATVAPFFVEAEAASPGKGAPSPRLQALALSNRHLEYALTWYALGATLIAVYFAYARARLRSIKQSSEI